MRLYRISPHEAANIQIESGTVLVIEDDGELLDLFAVLSCVRGTPVVERLLPPLRAAILGTTIPNNIDPTPPA